MNVDFVGGVYGVKLDFLIRVLVLFLEGGRSATAPQLDQDTEKG